MTQTPDTVDVSHILHRWVAWFLRGFWAETRRVLEAHDLTFAQLGVLMSLYHGQHCRLSDLGQRFAVTKGAMSQMVNRLEQAGLVTREADPHDRRARQLSLTPKGRQVVEDVVASRERWLAQVLARLHPEERVRAAEILERLTQAAQDVVREQEARTPSPSDKETR